MRTNTPRLERPDAHTKPGTVIQRYQSRHQCERQCALLITHRLTTQLTGLAILLALRELPEATSKEK